MSIATKHNGAAEDLAAGQRALVRFRFVTARQLAARRFDSRERAFAFASDHGAATPRSRRNARSGATMIAQLDLFAAPPPSPLRPAAPPARWRSRLIAGLRPSRPLAQRASAAKRGKEPAAPPVVVSEPQLPPLGAFAKIDGRWHQWRKLGCAAMARLGRRSPARP
jgi:hypothetical protein